MNNPLTKYADISAPKDLVFFNNHEFMVSDYTSLQRCTEGDSYNDEIRIGRSRPALVISHFPNPYTKQNGELFRRTRIVRIPRIYHTCEESYMVPQFSDYFPGHEPAALTNGSLKDFTSAGTINGYPFGRTSLTPLVPIWIGEDEFVDVVSAINKLLIELASPKNKYTWLENALDFLSGTLYTTVFTKLVLDSSYTRNLKKIDEYMESLNVVLRRKHPDLQIIPLSKSAMLSLDFQIPMEPKHYESYEQYTNQLRESHSTKADAGEQDKEEEEC